MGKVDYKVIQREFRELAEPRSVPVKDYTKHDKEWSEKGTAYNRKYMRTKYADPSLTKPNYDHQMDKRNKAGKLINQRHIVNDFRYQREIVEGTNHDRVLMRRAERAGKVRPNKQTLSELGTPSPQL